MTTVSVKVFGTNDPDVLGAMAARDGKPVQVTIHYTPRTTTSFNLSFREATELSDALQAVREGATSA